MQDDEAKRAIEFVEAFMQNPTTDPNDDTIEEPVDLVDALRMAERIEAKHGDFCDRFARLSEVVIALIRAYRNEYEQSHDIRHKIMGEEMEKIGDLLVESHEVTHILRFAIENKLIEEAE